VCVLAASVFIKYLFLLVPAVIMKDFTFLHDGIPKKLRNGLLNFKKLRDIVDKVR